VGAASVLQSSVVDMQRDVDFAMVVDPSLIIVRNEVTGSTDLTVKGLGIEVDYF